MASFNYDSTANTARQLSSLADGGGWLGCCQLQAIRLTMEKMAEMENHNYRSCYGSLWNLAQVNALVRRRLVTLLYSSSTSTPVTAG